MGPGTYSSTAVPSSSSQLLSTAHKYNVECGARAPDSRIRLRRVPSTLHTISWRSTVEIAPNGYMTYDHLGKSRSGTRREAIAVFLFFIRKNNFVRSERVRVQIRERWFSFFFATTSTNHTHTNTQTYISPTPASRGLWLHPLLWGDCRRGKAYTSRLEMMAGYRNLPRACAGQPALLTQR